VDSELFLVQDVTKFYKTSKCIDHAYFSTPVNQTTGILGLPKCGFTTLIKLLTTDFNPSSGSIYMGNELVVHGNKDSCAKKMGYCPQMNAMFPYLTGAQCLHTMGKVRGEYKSY
jgi:ABC-type multidrug transport system ATPase subunit